MKAFLWILLGILIAVAVMFLVRMGIVEINIPAFRYEYSGSRSSSFDTSADCRPGADRKVNGKYYLCSPNRSWVGCNRGLKPLKRSHTRADGRRVWEILCISPEDRRFS